MDRALADAVGTTDPDTEAQIVDTLIDRADPAAMRQVVERFDRLADAAAKRVVAAAGRATGLLRDAAQTPRALANVVEIVAAADASEMAYLLADALRGDDAPAHRAAAKALWRMSQRVNRPPDATRDDAEAPRRYRYVLRAVSEAVASFGLHRRRDVLAAGFCFAPACHPPLRHAMADRRAPAYPVVCDLLGRPTDYAVARTLLHYAEYEPTRAAVRQGLSRAGNERAVAAALEMAHLLISPEVRQTVRGVGSADRLTMRHAPLDAPASRRMARWVDTLPLDAGRHVAALAKLSASDDRLTRLTALRSLVRLRDERADEAVGAMCFDTEPAIARTATRHLMRREWPGLARLMVRLIGSPHAEVRAFAERQLAPVGFERYWSNWPRMNDEQRTLAGRALMRIDERFGAKLATKMAADAAGDRHRAVQMARHLRQETYFETQLVALAADDDARVAASAVKALAGLVDSEPAERAIRAALVHDDDRVRSNAIEALEQAARIDPSINMVGRLMRSRGNRCRATSIKALYAMPREEAMPALDRMLKDGNEDHRISALWVVERMNVTEVVEQVTRMAKGDASPRVRRRALRVVRGMAMRAQPDGRRAG